MRDETMLSKTLKNRFFYKVPVAGRKLGMTRTEAYEAARAGRIPTERDGRLLLVPKGPWDRKVKKLLGTKPRD